MILFRQRNKKSGLLQSKWTVEIRDHLKLKRRFAAFKDKGASRSYGNQLERLVAFKSSNRALDTELISWLESLPDTTIKRLHTIGLIDNETSTATIPLMVAKKAQQKRTKGFSFVITGGHLADYRSHLESKELANRYIKQTIAHIARIIDSCTFTFATDINTTSIEHYITKVRNTGISARTANASLTAIKGFCSWLVIEQRLTSDPVKRIKKFRFMTR